MEKMEGIMTRSEIKKLDTLWSKLIKDRANAILIGSVGLGKSHLSIALGYAACLAG